MNIVRKSKIKDPKERAYMVILHMAGVLDAAVYVLSLSYLSASFRTRALASDTLGDFFNIE